MIHAHSLCGGMVRVVLALVMVTGFCARGQGEMDALARGAVGLAQEEFGFGLLRAVADGDGDVAVSPVSVFEALCLLRAGAGGQTDAELARAMGLGLTGERLHTAVQAVRKGLTERAKAGGVELTVANAVWPDTTVRLLDDYVATVGRFYGAGARTLDYQDALAESCHTINDWVSTATRERIPELVSPDVIGRDTRMVLTNAVYFLGPWQRAFDPDQTRDDEFKGPDGTLPVRMMTQTSEFRYASADWGQALELPYVGNDLSMLLLLPASERTPRDLEEQLSREWLLELDARLRRQRTRVEIPSFRMEFSCSLVQALKTLGVETAFTGKADFSGMTGMAGDLYVSDVLHKVFVEVMEKGTEAAAATAVVMVRTSAANPREPVVFRADRPFVFVIRDGVSSSVLFLGRVTRPKSPPGA